MFEKIENNRKENNQLIVVTVSALDTKLHQYAIVDYFTTVLSYPNLFPYTLT